MTHSEVVKATNTELANMVREVRKTVELRADEFAPLEIVKRRETYPLILAEAERRLREETKC